MALIRCPECDREVSDKAANCIGCGSPLGASRAEFGSIGKRVSTIEETSKSLKKHIIWAAVLFWGGLILTFPAAESESTALFTASSLCVTAGFFWWLTTRIRIWWHHK